MTRARSETNNHVERELQKVEDDVPGRSGGGRAGIERDRRGAGLVEAPVVQGHRPAWAAERVVAVRRGAVVAGTAAHVARDII